MPGPLLWPHVLLQSSPGELTWPEASTLAHLGSTLPALLGGLGPTQAQADGGDAWQQGAELGPAPARVWALHTPDRAPSLPCQMQPQIMGGCPSPPRTSAFAQRSGCPSSACILAVTDRLVRPSEGWWLRVVGLTWSSAGRLDHRQPIPGGLCQEAPGSSSGCFQ